MNTDKCNCPIFRFILFLVSIALALATWYFDEGVHQLTFLTNSKEIVNFLGTVFVIFVLPIGIFYVATEKEKYRPFAKKLSLLGFLPAFFYLIYLLVSSYYL